MKKIPLLLATVCAVGTHCATAQVKLGNNLQSTDPSAALELEHPNKAFYMTRVSLGSTTDLATVPTPKAGMEVFNTNAAIAGTTANPALSGGKGIYYFDGSRWVGAGPAAAPATAAGDWHLGGNAGTADGASFLGTTDNVPFSIRVNSQPALRLDATNGNAFMGYQAGLNNTAGEGNTFLGHLSGQQATGSKNTGVGREALAGTGGAGTENLAIGYAAMQLNSFGSYNTAAGSRAMNKNSSGAYNTAVGYQAGYMNSSGSGNTAIGTNAGYGITSASGNTSIGAGALFYNIIGAGNLAIGFQAGQLNTASNNHFIGYQAGNNSSTGINNTFEGFQAGYSNITGSNNTAIGYGADLTSGMLTNAAAIGYNAKAGISNCLVLGGTGASAVSVGIGTTSPRALLDVAGSGAMIVPAGTTGDRPATPVPGMIRFNASTHRFEGYTDDVDTSNAVSPEPGWVEITAN